MQNNKSPEETQLNRSNIRLKKGVLFNWPHNYRGQNQKKTSRDRIGQNVIMEEQMKICKTVKIWTINKENKRKLNCFKWKVLGKVIVKMINVSLIINSINPKGQKNKVGSSLSIELARIVTISQQTSVTGVSKRI